MTKEQLIEEARKRGIVPGAVCKSPIMGHEYIVDEERSWYLDSGGGLTNSDGKMIWSATNQAWAEVVTPAPSEGLVDGMACDPDEHMRAAIVAKVDQLGIGDDSTFWRTGNKEYPAIGWNGSEIGDRRAKHESIMVKTWTTPGEFYDRLCRMVKPIKVGEHTVQFNPGSIKVGCTTIDNETVRAIAAKLKD